ncbi:S4 domain-containing protein, partial [Streptococcus sobrinus]
MEVIIKKAGLRLDKALADLTNLSRSQANLAIKEGTVLVNGRTQKAKYNVKTGDIISYE